MTDTDRLAALLHEIGCGRNDPWQACVWDHGGVAALLVAAGVTLAPTPPDALREAAQAAEAWLADTCRPDGEWVADGHNFAMNDSERERGTAILSALRAALEAEFSESLADVRVLGLTIDELRAAVATADQYHPQWRAALEETP